MTKLDRIIFDDTQVKNIEVLNNIGDFGIAQFDRTQVSDEDVVYLKFEEEKSIVVYKSEKLRVWWGNTDDSWQDIFKELNRLSDRPSSEDLHKLTSKISLTVQGTSIKNLDPLTEFIRLESLSFSDTRISSLYPLIGLSRLKQLICPRNPISDIEALTSLNSLEVLNLENTQIKDIKDITKLFKI